ncbi:hypothetical protein EZV61_15665 [Corallincola luteus]|uniref:Uncharacterized protein n=1 Tax=Corallincola luteus TaxID=1775177 RepID=A0ABY2AHI3_9GAMM|nr:hypothetical protein [Corallincola luteus]TCI02012.1 hypothetical protein EZV61_15665 [Corallincola luteus]
MNDNNLKGWLQKSELFHSIEQLEKHRVWLAKMALHLFQTALKTEPMELDKLRNNLHAILTISDQFLPDAKLDRAKDHLY